MVFEMAPVRDPVRPRTFFASASNPEVPFVGAVRVDEAATRQEVALPAERRRRRRDVRDGEAAGDEHQGHYPEEADHCAQRYWLTHADLFPSVRHRRVRRPNRDFVPPFRFDMCLRSGDLTLGLEHDAVAPARDAQGNEHVGGAVGADDDLDAVARVMRTASPDESYSRYSRRLRGSIRSGAASLSPTSPTIPNIARSLPAVRGATDRRLIARSSTAPRERRLQARGGIFGGRSRA